MPDTRPSVATAITILLIFFSIGIVCLYIPITHLMMMISSIISDNPQIKIDKGSYYLLGAGIALLALLPDGYYNSVLKSSTPKMMENWIRRIAIGGCILILILPPLIHYPAAIYLEKHNYSECEAKSSQWLFVRTIVYTKSNYCG